MQFAIDELIIYGETGVCRVVDIVEKPFLGVVQSCYQLQPIYQSCAIFTPVNNCNVYMRPIITREEAEALIANMPSVSPEIVSASSPRELTEKYDKIIKLHDCGKLIELTKSIYIKREKVLANKKKLSAIDERFLKKAEDLLFGELAAALDIDKTAVTGYIESKVNI